MVVVEGECTCAATCAMNLWVEGRKQEIAVGKSVPAPVEVIVAFATVSVANKLMSLLLLSDSRISHRSVLGKVIIYQAVPLLVGVPVTIFQVRALVVAEISH